ncbi:MAG: metal ABC transporter permease [Chloroflexota bacterium]
MPDPLSLGFMQNAYLVGTMVAIVASAVGFFVVLRGLAFAGHALSHIGFSGATGAVLVGVSPLTGLLTFSIVAAVAMGALGERLRGRDVAIGIVLAFSLGLGALFITLYTGYAGEAISILFGTIIGVSRQQVLVTGLLGLLVLVGLGTMYRPLLFMSVAEDVAMARGLPVRVLSAAFLVLVAVAVSVSVQVVGVLVIFALLIAPAATAAYLSARVLRGIGVAVVIGIVEVWLGITLAYYTSYPDSFFIAAIAVVFYGAARGVSRLSWVGSRQPEGASV